ncbi:hypothetical protein ACFXD5_19410 [Streptomyces sp. NPDC059385]|uniref:hypothetical protein n=1 Tax=Streptomyces sp. NPDC059385 TaxID=3346817 RepID=UPI00367ED180
MKRFQVDRGTLRAVGFVTLVTVVFLVTNTSVAAAADGSGASGGLLGALDIRTSEGLPLSGYQLEASAAPPTVGRQIENVVSGGLSFDVVAEVQRLVLSGLFTLVRLLVGLCCWLIGFIFKFPLLRLLTDPAQNLADAYQRHVVNALGLPALLLAWAFVFGLITFARGKVGQGLGEIALTLVIAALAASAFVRPDYLLGKDGPLDQTHQAAIEVASITTASYFDSPGRGGRPCDTAVGPAHDACVKEQAEAKTVTTPIQNALTDALVVKPYMLLQYGRVLDPKNKDEADAYKAHRKWVQSNAAMDKPARPPKDKDPCGLLDGPSKEYCESQNDGTDTSKNEDCSLLVGSAKEYCEAQASRADTSKCDGMFGPLKEDCESRQKKPDYCAPLDPLSEKRCREHSTEIGFTVLLKDLQGSGAVGKAAAAYAERPSWDRVWSVVALLVAVFVVSLMIVSMAVVMLGAQGADAAAAAAGPIAWVWAMLPGPSRMLLWRWVGVFVVSALTSFVAAMGLPLFGIAVDALLAKADAGQMMERLLLVDALAIGFLAMHRRLLAGAAGFGQRMATRMRFAKIGGTHLRGDSSEFGASLAMHGPTARAALGGLAGGMGFSAVHGAFGARLRSLGSLTALTDGTGMPFSPSRLLGDAVAEGRRGIAPLAIALRAAHTALIGPKPATHPAAAQLHAHAANGGRNPGTGSGEMVVDRWTGEILHDPATDRPLLGSRIHAHASRLRGYRIAARTARTAYGTTVGLPRNLHRARATGSQYTQDALQQLRVSANHLREDGHAWAQAGRSVRDRVDHVGQAVGTAWQVHDPVGTVRNTALAALIATAPLANSRGLGSRNSVGRQNLPTPTATPPAARTTNTPRRSVQVPVNTNAASGRPGSQPQGPAQAPSPSQSRPSSPAPSPAQGPIRPPARQEQAEAQANRDRLMSVINARRAAARQNPGGEQ